MLSEWARHFTGHAPRRTILYMNRWFWKRLLLLLLLGVVIALTCSLWTDPWTGGVLLAADFLMATLLVAGWRQVGQEERDAREIAVRQESQRLHAQEMPREDRREIAPQSPPAVPAEGDEDDDG